MINGILVVNKEKGLTSFQTVNKVRKALGANKAGHTGTLDPLATGVLPVLLGTYTKLADILVDGEKEYIATAKFGLTTDTLDITGSITEEVDRETLFERTVSTQTLTGVLNTFVGDIKQVPPMYSALKKDGKRLYELARMGVEIEREPRDITIYKIELLKFNFPEFTFKVRCSKGTYIRSLIRDIGLKLDLPAVMTDLVRTMTGGFTLNDAVDMADIDTNDKRSRIIKADTIFFEYPRIKADDKFSKLLINGVKIKDPALVEGIKTEGMLRLYDSKDEFLGLAEFNNGELKLKYRV